jgi:hypothetical protein
MGGWHLAGSEGAMPAPTRTEYSCCGAEPKPVRQMHFMCELPKHSLATTENNDPKKLGHFNQNRVGRVFSTRALPRGNAKRGYSVVLAAKAEKCADL